MKLYKLFLNGLLLVFGIASIVSCGGSSLSSSSSTSTTSTGTGTATASSLDISAAVPADVVVAAPTEDDSLATSSLSAVRLSSGMKADLKTGDPDGSDYQAKKDAIGNLIDGAGDCAFTFKTDDIVLPNCYGSTITGNNSPDAPGQAVSLPAFDLGMWSSFEVDSHGTNTGEACAAAYANKRMEAISERLDNMISLVAATACAAKKDGLGLPENPNGDSVDLLTAVTNHVNLGKVATFKIAKVERLDDSADGDPTYKTTLSLDIDPGNGTTATAHIILTNIPLNDDNTLHQGKLSFSYSLPIDVRNCQVGKASGETFAGTMLYDTPDTSTLNYELKYAVFCGSDAEPFDENEDIAFSNKVSLTNPNGWGADATYALQNQNSDTGASTLQHAWQAGAQDGATRVINISVTAASGVEIGKAYYGFGLDIAKSTGTINGMICSWIGPNETKGLGHINPDPLVQFEGMTRDVGTPVFKPDSSTLALTYAPTNNCNTTAGFTYSSSIGTMSNDNSTGKVVTNNLLSLSAYQAGFTQLTAPDIGL